MNLLPEEHQIQENVKGESPVSPCTPCKQASTACKQYLLASLFRTGSNPTNDSNPPKLLCPTSQHPTNVGRRKHSANGMPHARTQPYFVYLSTLWSLALRTASPAHPLPHSCVDIPRTPFHGPVPSERLSPSHYAHTDARWTATALSRCSPTAFMQDKKHGRDDTNAIAVEGSDAPAPT